MGNNPRIRYTLVDMYKIYERNIVKGGLYDVGYKKFRVIFTEYINMMMRLIIERSGVFKLPSRLGKVYVAKHRPKRISGGFGLNVDFQNSKKLGKKIYHLNEHTDGYQYRFIWDRYGASVHNIAYYELIHTRTLKRSLAREIKNNKRDYVERGKYD